MENKTTQQHPGQCVPFTHNAVHLGWKGRAVAEHNPCEGGVSV
jgi:hypothetical protein